MTVIDDHGRPEPPIADELDSVLGFLDYQRATLEWKCRGLDAAGLRATTAASSMTLRKIPFALWNDAVTRSRRLSLGGKRRFYLGRAAKALEGRSPAPPKLPR